LEKENKLMSQYLSEAFKRLDALNEETFSITDNGLEDYVEFQDNDELDTTIDVIDMEAETEEDLEDSYVGKVILDCCVCHSKLYKDVEDVVVDGDIANADEECPFCYTTDGYKVIGQVASFGEDEEEKKDDKEDPAEEETPKDESLKENIKRRNRKPLKEGVDSNIYSAVGRHYKYNLPSNTAEVITDLVERAIDNYDSTSEVLEAVVQAIDEGLIYNSDIWAIKAYYESAELSDETYGELYNDIYSIVESLIEEDVNESKIRRPHKTVKESDRRNPNKVANEGLFGIKTKKEKEKEARAKAEREAKKKADKENAERIERERQADVVRGWKEREARERQSTAEYNRSRYNSIKGDKSSNTGYRGVQYSGGDYYTESKSIKEDIYPTYYHNRIKHPEIYAKEASILNIDNNKKFIDDTQTFISKKYPGVIVEIPNEEDLSSIFPVVAVAIPKSYESEIDAIKEYIQTNTPLKYLKPWYKYTVANNTSIDDNKYFVFGCADVKTFDYNSDAYKNISDKYVQRYNSRHTKNESKSIKESIDEKFIIKLDNMNGSRDAFISKNAPTNPDDKLFNDVDSWFTYNKEDVMIFNSYSDAEHFWDEYVIGIPLLADSDDNYTWSMKNCIVKYNDKMESIKESVNNVNVETDDGIVNVSSDENGRVTVTTEPNTSGVSDTEVITPLEPEVQSEISDNVGDGEEIEIDMDEFDEESFDELGEGYLKRVYENVNSFKTSNVSFIKDKLILEGVIKFNSGKAKKTNFIFGIREATKSGKVRFIGENKEIARGRKSFTVTGRVENKKFLSESFNYNYGVRNANGKAQRLYGTIKNTKRGK
jgi:hypothetical protein